MSEDKDVYGTLLYSSSIIINKETKVVYGKAFISKNYDLSISFKSPFGERFDDVLSSILVKNRSNILSKVRFVSSKNKDFVSEISFNIWKNVRGKLFIPYNDGIVSKATIPFISELDVKYRLSQIPSINTNLDVLKDAYVFQGRPKKNFGNLGVLNSLSSLDGNSEIYLSFDLSLIKEQISEGNSLKDAEFTLNSAELANLNKSFDLYIVYSSWEEYYITWDNKPNYQEYIGTFKIDVLKKTIDVSTVLSKYLLRPETEITFLIKSEEAVSFYARESFNGSLLEISTYDQNWNGFFDMFDTISKSIIRTNNVFGLNSVTKLEEKKALNSTASILPLEDKIYGWTRINSDWEELRLNSKATFDKIKEDFLSKAELYINKNITSRVLFVNSENSDISFISEILKWNKLLSEVIFVNSEQDYIKSLAVVQANTDNFLSKALFIQNSNSFLISTGCVDTLKHNLVSSALILSRSSKTDLQSKVLFEKLKNNLISYAALISSKDISIEAKASILREASVLVRCISYILHREDILSSVHFIKEGLIDFNSKLEIVLRNTSDQLSVVKLIANRNSGLNSFSEVKNHFDIVSSAKFRNLANVLFNSKAEIYSIKDNLGLWRVRNTLFSDKNSLANILYFSELLSSSNILKFNNKRSKAIFRKSEDNLFLCKALVRVSEETDLSAITKFEPATGISSNLIFRSRNIFEDVLSSTTLVYPDILNSCAKINSPSIIINLDTTPPKGIELNVELVDADSSTYKLIVTTTDLRTDSYEIKIWGTNFNLLDYSYVEPALENVNRNYFNLYKTLSRDQYPYWQPYKKEILIKRTNTYPSQIYVSLRDDVWNESDVVSLKLRPILTEKSYTDQYCVFENILMEIPNTERSKLTEKSEISFRVKEKFRLTDKLIPSIIGKDLSKLSDKNLIKVLSKEKVKYRTSSVVYLSFKDDGLVFDAVNKREIMFRDLFLSDDASIQTILLSDIANISSDPLLCINLPEDKEIIEDSLARKEFYEYDVAICDEFERISYYLVDNAKGDSSEILIIKDVDTGVIKDIVVYKDFVITESALSTEILLPAVQSRETSSSLEEVSIETISTDTYMAEDVVNTKEFITFDSVLLEDGSILYVPETEVANYYSSTEVSILEEDVVSIKEKVYIAAPETRVLQVTDNGLVCESTVHYEEIFNGRDISYPIGFIKNNMFGMPIHKTDCDYPFSYRDDVIYRWRMAESSSDEERVYSRVSTENKIVLETRGLYGKLKLDLTGVKEYYHAVTIFFDGVKQVFNIPNTKVLILDLDDREEVAKSPITVVIPRDFYFTYSVAVVKVTYPSLPERVKGYNFENFEYNRKKFFENDDPVVATDINIDALSRFNLFVSSECDTDLLPIFDPKKLLVNSKLTKGINDYSWINPVDYGSAVARTEIFISVSDLGKVVDKLSNRELYYTDGATSVESTYIDKSYYVKDHSTLVENVKISVYGRDIFEILDSASFLKRDFSDSCRATESITLEKFNDLAYFLCSDNANLAESTKLEILSSDSFKENEATKLYFKTEDIANISDNILSKQFTVFDTLFSCENTVVFSENFYNKNIIYPESGQFKNSLYNLPIIYTDVDYPEILLNRGYIKPIYKEVKSEFDNDQALQFTFTEKGVYNNSLDLTGCFGFIKIEYRLQDYFWSSSKIVVTMANGLSTTYYLEDSDNSGSGVLKIPYDDSKDIISPILISVIVGSTSSVKENGAWVRIITPSYPEHRAGQKIPNLLYSSCRKEYFNTSDPISLDVVDAKISPWVKLFFSNECGSSIGENLEGIKDLIANKDTNTLDYKWILSGDIGVSLETQSEITVVIEEKGYISDILAEKYFETYENFTAKDTEIISLSKEDYAVLYEDIVVELPLSDSFDAKDILLSKEYVFYDKAKLLEDAVLSLTSKDTVNIESKEVIYLYVDDNACGTDKIIYKEFVLEDFVSFDENEVLELITEDVFSVTSHTLIDLAESDEGFIKDTLIEKDFNSFDSAELCEYAIVQKYMPSYLVFPKEYEYLRPLPVILWRYYAPIYEVLVEYIPFLDCPDVDHNWGVVIEPYLPPLINYPGWIWKPADETTGGEWIPNPDWPDEFEDLIVPKPDNGSQLIPSGDGILDVPGWIWDPEKGDWVEDPSYPEYLPKPAKPPYDGGASKEPGSNSNPGWIWETDPTNPNGGLWVPDPSWNTNWPTYPKPSGNGSSEPWEPSQRPDGWTKPFYPEDKQFDYVYGEDTSSGEDGNEIIYIPVEDGGKGPIDPINIFVTDCAEVEDGALIYIPEIDLIEFLEKKYFDLDLALRWIDEFKLEFLDGFEMVLSLQEFKFNFDEIKFKFLDILKLKYSDIKINYQIDIIKLNEDKFKLRVIKRDLLKVVEAEVKFIAVDDFKITIKEGN